MSRRIGFVVVSICAVALLASCGGEGEKKLRPPKPVPAEYANKHMPEGWWTDPKIFADGKEIFEGRFDVDVNCASCHGKTGKPKKRGARDFRVQDRMKLYSDSYMLWRVSEGVPKTKMKAWKKKLSEEDRWKVIVYLHKFSHGDSAAPHDDYVSPVAAPSATPASVPPATPEEAPASQGTEN
jgi:mono/diheme cytochrome c family protein